MGSCLEDHPGGFVAVEAYMTVETADLLLNGFLAFFEAVALLLELLELRIFYILFEMVQGFVRRAVGVVFHSKLEVLSIKVVSPIDVFDGR